MLNNLLKEYSDIQKQEEEIKLRKDEVGKQIKDLLEEQGINKYTSPEGITATVVEKVTFKYNDETAIINYLTMKGLSDIYLQKKIDTTKLNKELKNEGILYENVKSYLTKNITKSLNLKK